MAKRKVIKKKVAKKNIAKGIVYINATFNNTMVTITDEMGNVIAWSSAGGLGFKGSKKSTPYAAQQAVEDALAKAKQRILYEAKERDICAVHYNTLLKLYSSMR